MKIRKESALLLAENLMQIKAIKLEVANPFTWASGIISPIYCDNRLTLSFPKLRTYIRQQLVEMINEDYGPVDVIAGVATGAIAQGALVAQEMGLPFVYIRSSEKKHGLTNKIEGRVESGQSVVVVEDLVSTGQSSLNAVDALRDAGCNVKGMVAIFTYKLKVAEDNFKNAKCDLSTLTDYDILVEKAIEQKYIKDTDIETLIKWRENPREWGK